ncbi:hypothetical protein [Planomicrobium sp. CPCC 101110]|uniref:hypothetical protein n=1 Tax=Planomicrobium sp. CPCC 101110 TaxID=2599619 RepID=UPI0011B43B21|nr:hypothetical protein [Planomicrobium sp. CPCC 101110]TWT24908.1 hypothetical protein FQV30_15570 [Planomicrobium sp. CPCC 101110]
MKAPEEILAVWRKFDEFPMETFTKAWFYSKAEGKRQRTVALMKAHRERYGISGNCFDLAIWLMDEFAQAGIKAYPVGSHLNTEDAHVGLVAEDSSGNRYLCDLGDLWLQPILIDGNSKAFTKERLSGFFPAAEVQVLPKEKEVEIIYHRPNGKQSKQSYETDPIALDFFMAAAEFSQNHVYPKPLFEKRIPYKDEIAHWEFDDWKSFLSTSEGLFSEAPLSTTEEWAERIHKRTGADKVFLTETLRIYEKMDKIQEKSGNA